jgi:hypothetical protein
MLVSKVYGDTSMDVRLIRTLKPKLRQFLRRFDDCFPRKDTRAHMPVYVSGVNVGGKVQRRAVADGRPKSVAPLV